MELLLSGHWLKLLPEKAIWIESQKALVIADVHLDKAAHFRKNGIPVPNLEADGSLKYLERLISTFQPKQLWVLGDLVHVDAGKELSSFLNITRQIPACKLITGNHDKNLRSMHFDAHWEFHASFTIGDLLLTHGDQALPEKQGSISGHWHPGFKLKLEFKKEVFPAFILRDNHHLILPAFGKFTGLNSGFVRKEDQAFLIHSGKILPITDF